MTAVTGARRRRSAGSGKRRVGPLASPRFGRWLFVAMTLLGVCYLGAGLYRIAHAARNYGMVYMGMSRPEVRYVLGSPAVVGAGGALWRMRDDEAETTVLFDANDRVDTIGCRTVGAGGDCPDMLGVRIGDNEGAVWERLGYPTDETYAGETKIMGYPALGMRVKLRRTTVVALEHRHVSGILPFAARALSLLAP